MRGAFSRPCAREAAASPVRQHGKVEPYIAFAAGRQNDVPILIGSNSEEGQPMNAGIHVKLATSAEDIAKPFEGSKVVRDLAVPEDVSCHDRQLRCE